MGRYNPAVVLYIDVLVKYMGKMPLLIDLQVLRTAFSPEKLVLHPKSWYQVSPGSRWPPAAGWVPGEQSDRDARSSSNLEMRRFSNSAVVLPTNVPTSVADASLGRRIILWGTIGPLTF